MLYLSEFSCRILWSYCWRRKSHNKDGKGYELQPSCSSTMFIAQSRVDPLNLRVAATVCRVALTADNNCSEAEILTSLIVVRFLLLFVLLSLIAGANWQY